ncbi:hypothetical protein MNAN1_004014 [Malassezia nana]|uniref:Uncharacterized protein n=1 Tax=Malassezia nana TaxID=180528 RepID=A0AAF0EMT7_9BASI|nr:hypothetical protein MNAN1_004014 [Malassezia nana]
MINIWKEWTNNPKSPHFIKSLSYMCNRGTQEHMNFMTKAGICMVKCSKSDQDVFTHTYNQICDFYSAHAQSSDCHDSQNMMNDASIGDSKNNANSFSTKSQDVKNGPSDNGTSSIEHASGSTKGHCDVTYSVQPEPECIPDCNRQAGQSVWKNWTDNPKSPNFIKSLNFICERDTQDYMNFRTKGGICMVKCSKQDQDVFKNTFNQI